MCHRGQGSMGSAILVIPLAVIASAHAEGQRLDHGIASREATNRLVDHLVVENLFHHRASVAMPLQDSLDMEHAALGKPRQPSAVLSARRAYTLGGSPPPPPSRQRGRNRAPKWVLPYSRSPPLPGGRRPQLRSTTLTRQEEIRLDQKKGTNLTDRQKLEEDYALEPPEPADAWKHDFLPESDANRIGALHRLVAENVKGLPWGWDYLWKLPFARRGAPGEALTLGDTMHIFRTNIEQIYGKCPSYDGAPLAEGNVAGLGDGTMYLALWEFYKKVGGVFKLCFGPKSFMVVSDPVMMKHILQDNVKAYDKGVLAEILKPIMGNGLIPADAGTSKIRRRAILPGFHRKWIDRMVTLFGEQTARATKVLDKAADSGEIVDIEERVGSLALDIIGMAVFDYDFNSTFAESPVVKAAISVLKEAEHRSMVPLPYWDLPFMTDVVPRQVEFKKNMAMLNERLDACIKQALANRNQDDVTALQQRDYASMENPSMLRFMVDMRDEDVTSAQLRDDLMTMLIAGHETTASALTWAIFELAQQPTLLARLQSEVDQYLPDEDALPTIDVLRDLKLTRLCIAESLRMYPQPPLLIRRAIEEDTLPAGTSGREVKLLRGMDLFLSVYNMQRSSLYWDHPDTFDPERFTRKKESTVNGWAGFDPAKWMERGWYPNAAAADFAYLPFGAGPRKCIGDQFAMLEATVALASFVRRYDFEFAGPTATPDQVGTATGATIHTRNGLWMKVSKRKLP